MSEVTHTATFQPLKWQLKPLLDKHRVVLLSGPAGAGRSRCCGEKINAFLKKYPGSTGLMMRKKRQSMTNSTVLFFDRTIKGRDPTVHHVPSKFRFEYENGSILAYGGMADKDQKESIRSIGQDGSLDICWMEEANRFDEEDYNEIIARMRGRAANWTQILLSTNPDAPNHWIRRRLILSKEAHTYVAGPLDNPYLPKEYIANLMNMTGVTGARLRDGKWVQAEGVVYPEWEDDLHCIDPFPIPDDWRRVRGIDFGFTNPFSCQWWAIDPDGRMYLYREIYMSRRTVRDHATLINAYSEGEAIEITVADHDAEDRATLEESGIITIPANKDIESGLKFVRERLRKAGDGKPRMYIFNNCLVEIDPDLQERKKPISILEEFPAYVWAESLVGKMEKEIPLKLNDHGMDCARYVTAYVEGAEGFGMGYA